MMQLLAQVSSETDLYVAQNIFFAVIAVTMIYAAFRVVTTANVVHAALWLVVVLAGGGARRWTPKKPPASRHPGHTTPAARHSSASLPKSPSSRSSSASLGAKSLRRMSCWVPSSISSMACFSQSCLC